MDSAVYYNIQSPTVWPRVNTYFQFHPIFHFYCRSIVTCSYIQDPDCCMQSLPSLMKYVSLEYVLCLMHTELVNPNKVGR